MFSLPTLSASARQTHTEAEGLKNAFAINMIAVHHSLRLKACFCYKDVIVAWWSGIHMFYHVPHYPKASAVEDLAKVQLRDIFVDLRCVFQLAVNSLNQRVIYGIVSLIISIHEFGNQRMEVGWTLSLSHQWLACGMCTLHTWSLSLYQVDAWMSEVEHFLQRKE